MAHSHHHNHSGNCTHCGHEHHHTGNRNTLIRVIFALIIFIAGFLTPENFRFAVFLTAYAICGWDVLYRAAKKIFRGEVFDENFLMGIATIGAIALKEYPEAVMVMILYQIGEMFQDYAVDKSRKSITELMDIRPDYANIEKDGSLVKVSPADVHPGSIITVKTGEKIPLDGIIIEGEAVLDTSALTGESVPRKVYAGSSAISGCINLDGVLKIRTEKEFGESTAAKILELVESAAEKKAKTENFITKFARYYTPFVVIAALLLAIIPPLIIKGALFTDWLSRALTFLVISCPCALVISVPLGFFAGIGGASKKGILIKGSSFIETMSRPDTVVFDKTGTLTKGVFKVTAIKPEGLEESELLKICAYAEIYSNHPVAISIKEAYGKRIDRTVIKDVKETAGKGVKAIIGDDEVLAGNSRFLKDAGVDFEAQNNAGTIIYIAVNGKYKGCIIISDEIKEDAKLAVKQLKKLAKQVVMLTGDNRAAAEAAGNELGIGRIYAQLLPAQKVEKLEEIIQHKSKNHSVIFAGDGINDAPVLTRADAGIAMGAMGSDAAIEAADIVIMDDKPSKIAEAIKISQKTMFIVKENITFAIGIKVLFLILGAFGLVTMWGAVFADVGVAVLAIANSLRALKI